jgi:hypothetical protein
VSAYSLLPNIMCGSYAVNLAQAAGTYDLATAGGDLLILQVGLYCLTAGVTWTSAAIQTDDTTPFVIMNATEGARANFTAAKNVAITWTQVQKPILVSGKKLQLTMAGSTGTGTARLSVLYAPMGAGSLV